jgi:hypothetical protein
MQVSQFRTGLWPPAPVRGTRNGSLHFLSAAVRGTRNDFNEGCDGFHAKHMRGKEAKEENSSSGLCTDFFRPSSLNTKYRIAADSRMNNSLPKISKQHSNFLSWLSQRCLPFLKMLVGLIALAFRPGITRQNTPGL